MNPFDYVSSLVLKILLLSMAFLLIGCDQLPNEAKVDHRVVPVLDEVTVEPSEAVEDPYVSPHQGAWEEAEEESDPIWQKPNEGGIHVAACEDKTRPVYFFEAAAEGRTLDFGSEFLSAEEKVQYVIDQLEPFDPLRHQFLSRFATFLFLTMTPRQDLDPIDDAGPVIIPPGCRLATAMRLGLEDRRQTYISYDPDHWALLNKDGRAGLVLNALLYFDGIHSMHRNGVKARRLASYVSSTDLSTSGAEFYRDLLASHGYGMQRVVYREEDSSYRGQFFLVGDKIYFGRRSHEGSYENGSVKIYSIPKDSFDGLPVTETLHFETKFSDYLYSTPLLEYHEGFFYWAIPDGDRYQFLKRNLATGEETKLFRADYDNETGIQVKDGYLYYATLEDPINVSDAELWRVKLDDGHPELLGRFERVDFISFKVDHGVVAVNAGGSFKSQILMIDLASKKTRTVFNHMRISAKMIFSEGKLYIKATEWPNEVMHGSIQEYDLETGAIREIVRFAHGFIGAWHVQAGVVYYQIHIHEAEGERFWAMEMKSGATQIIDSYPWFGTEQSLVNQVTIDGDHLYYQGYGSEIGIFQKPAFAAELEENASQGASYYAN